MYDIQFAPAAIRDFKKLTNAEKQQLASEIDTLQENPRPNGAIKMKGETGKLNLYRLRIGDFRIVYQIRDEQLIILLLVIAKRKDVYDLLKQRIRSL